MYQNLFENATQLYINFLPSGWGLSGLESLALFLIVGTVLISLCLFLIAVLRGQPTIAQAVLVDCLLGTIAVATVIGSWCAIYFFGRATLRALVGGIPTQARAG